MVEELEKLVWEIRRVNDPKLRKQTKRFKNALHNYLAKLDSLLEVRRKAEATKCEKYIW